MIRLTKHQLFTLMFIFEIGSTTLFALGIEAKQDAWIVILIALLIGLGYIWIYTEIQNAFPDKNYIEIIIAILGKVLGTPLALLYPLEWIWHAARNLREFGELIVLTALPKTHLWIILLLFLGVSVYSLLKGTEVLARASEIALPVLLLFLIIIYILIYISGYVDFNRLTPVLGEGILPILKTVPRVVMFPFGEMFIFLMYWCNAEDKSSIRRTSMVTVLESGILLCISMIVEISVLGVKYASIATIPMLEVIRLINVGNIISNIDVLGVMIIFMGGFFKMSIYLNGIVQAFATVFKTRKYKLVLVLVSAFLFWFSMAFEANFAVHKWMYPFDIHFFGLLYTSVFPPLLLFIYMLKKKRCKL